MYNLMFWDENLCKCQLCLFGLMCHLRPIFLYRFSFGMIYLELLIEYLGSLLGLYFCLFLPLVVSSCFMYFGAPLLAAYIEKYYVFLM